MSTGRSTAIKYFRSTSGKSLRRNEQIRISPIRLIDENDEQVGVVELVDAKARALQAGLDLVEVSPKTRPPVCRIMDYGKWKYAQQKKERKGRAKHHDVELKEIRIRTPKIGDHDLGIKIQHAHQFLTRGDRVQFSLRYRGRELAHIEEGYKVFDRIKEALDELMKVEQDYRREGRRITMLLVPAPHKVEAKKKAEAEAKAAGSPATPAAEAPPTASAEAPPAS